MAILAAVATLALAAAAGPARGDGDPASDVLISQSTFVPWDAGVSPAQQARLGALLRATAAAGFPIRVALIASAADLGSVTALWHEPQTYAEYLGDELSLAFHGYVLVVMPNGVGLYRSGIQPHVEAHALAGLSSLRGRGELETVAARTVRRLASTSGHTLSVARTTGAAPAATLAGPSDPTPWIVFIVGIALILLAWSASLRARPVRLPGRRVL